MKRKVFICHCQKSKLLYACIATIFIVHLFVFDNHIAFALSPNSVNRQQDASVYYFASETKSNSVTRLPLATTDDNDDGINNGYYPGIESLSRSRSHQFYKRLVVGSDGGRPQVTALDMVCKDESSETATPLPQFNKNDFEMHVGHALDTLRNDYPKILINDPDYSIYDPKLEVVDPSGVRVHGLRSYKNAFRVMHALVRILYCPEKSGISMRLCYDQARCVIRIHWNAYVVPREIFGGSRTTNYVDGISVYEFDRLSGNITEHRIEQILINDAPVMPKEGVIAALQQQHTVTVPMFVKYQQEIVQGRNNIVVPFQQLNPLQSMRNLLAVSRNNNPSSLFAWEATTDDQSSYEDDVDDAIKSQYPSLDWTAFRNKNKSRKKFGLKPITPEEFMEIEAKVQEMATLQEERFVQDQSQSPSRDKDKNKKGGLLSKMFGNVLEDTCESNYDCVRPEICCDFGFQKRCCSAGTPVGRWDQMQPIRVPPEIRGDYPGNPNDFPRNY